MIELLNTLIHTQQHTLSSTISAFLAVMTDKDFAKVPCLQMTDEAMWAIKSQAMVFDTDRGTFYSCGGQLFMIQETQKEASTSLIENHVLANGAEVSFVGLNNFIPEKDPVFILDNNPESSFNVEEGFVINSMEKQNLDY